MFGEEGQAGERNDSLKTEEAKPEEPKVIVVKGMGKLPKFKTWAEREKYFMKHPKERK